MKSFLILFSLLGGLWVQSDPLLEDEQIDPLFWNPMYASMKHVIGGPKAAVWADSLNLNDKRTGVSLLRNFYRAYLGKTGEPSEWIRKYESDVYGVLGEMYASSYARKELIKEGQTYLDGYQYQYFNPRGCKPDGLLFRKLPNGEVIIDKIIESKMDGEQGFYVGQVLCTLWRWSREGLQISETELVYPDRLSLNYRNEIHALPKLNFENLEEISKLARGMVHLFGVKLDTRQAEPQGDFVALPLEPGQGWDIARLFIGILSFPGQSPDDVWTQVKFLPARTPLLPWMREDNAKKYLRQLEFMIAKEKAGPSVPTLGDKFESYRKAFDMKEVPTRPAKRAGLRIIDPTIIGEKAFAELSEYVRTTGNYPKGSQGPEARKHLRSVSALGGQPGVFILMDEETQDLLFQNNNMPPKYPLQMRIMASSPSHQSVHALVLYLITYDLSDKEGLLNTLRKRSFLWKLVLRSLTAEQLIKSEGIDSSTLNNLTSLSEKIKNCARQLADFWADLKSAWRPRN